MPSAADAIEDRIDQIQTARSEVLPAREADGKAVDALFRPQVQQHSADPWNRPIPYWPV